jgi:hypothetical protein
VGCGGWHRPAAPDWKRAAMSCSAAAVPGWKLVAGGGAGLEAGSRRRGQARWSGQLVRAAVGARATALVRVGARARAGARRPAAGR